MQNGRPNSGRDTAIEISLREICDLQAHAARLALLIQSIDGSRPANPANDGPCDEAFVRAVMRARLSRARFFSSDLFADPAWDMLLGLYAAELAQQRMSVTSLCVTSNVPTTTALRWISHMERQGYIVRRPDPLDARRFFLSLSDQASKALAQYFAETPRFALAG
jgi:DNA-binding MarR family transcriptional regulator